MGAAEDYPNTDWDDTAAAEQENDGGATANEGPGENA